MSEGLLRRRISIVTKLRLFTTFKVTNGGHSEHSEECQVTKMKDYYVYIMTNLSRTLYTGVTNNLSRRVYEHKNKLIEGFTKKYNITLLMYFEVFNNNEDAIPIEKQIKGWVRKKKIALIESINLGWKDLYEELVEKDSSFSLRVTNGCDSEWSAAKYLKDSFGEESP